MTSSLYAVFEKEQENEDDDIVTDFVITTEEALEAGYSTYIEEVFEISEIFKTKLIDYDGKSVIMQCLQTEARNDALIALMKKRFLNRIELVRGGSVAIEAIAIAER